MRNSDFNTSARLKDTMNVFQQGDILNVFKNVLTEYKIEFSIVKGQWCLPHIMNDINPFEWSDIKIDPSLSDIVSASEI